ncbi:hypothetical protein [Bacillus sp. JJ722]|uniref:hypothetical protein n=1 Tax=Bacillus sp. JJ722 TaxID=3122973 RepID=UPI002FFDF9ED
MKTEHYVKTDWFDELEDPVTGEEIEEGTKFTAKRANNFEDGIFRAHVRIDENERDDKRRDISIEMLTKAPGSSGVFFDVFDGTESSKFVLDKSKADIIEAVAAGTTVLKVDNVEGFKVFTQITIYDDANSENKQITAIDEANRTITVQALTNGYKKGAKVARSTVVIDTEIKELKFGTWDIYKVEVV